MSVEIDLKIKLGFSQKTALPKSKPRRQTKLPRLLLVITLITGSSHPYVALYIGD